MAAEAVSVTFLQCTLKGLQRSPRVITDRATMARPGVLTAEDVSCLVIPDGCLGLPTLAALEQRIPGKYQYIKVTFLLQQWQVSVHQGHSLNGFLGRVYGNSFRSG